MVISLKEESSVEWHYQKNLFFTIADSLRAMDLESCPFDETPLLILYWNPWLGDCVVPSLLPFLFTWPTSNWYGYYCSCRLSCQLAWHQSQETPECALWQWSGEYKLGDQVSKLNANETHPKKGPFRIVQVHTNETVTIQRSRLLKEWIYGFHL